MLVVLNVEQSLIASFPDLIECVEQHIAVELDVLCHLGSSYARHLYFGGSHCFDSVS